MIHFAADMNVAGAGIDSAGLVYDESGQSFVATAGHGREWHSVLVNDLELHVDQDGRVLYVDGYAPRKAWSNSDAEPPSAVTGAIHTTPRPDLPRGSSVWLDPSRNQYPSNFNPWASWLCVGDADDSGATAIQVNPATIMVIRGEQLVALWLQVRSSCGSSADGPSAD